MKVVALADAPAYYDKDNPSARSGANGDKLLLVGTEDSLDNYKLTLGSVVSVYTTPRHRHNFDQLRYPISGDYVYAKDKAIPPGWVGYFPEGAYYGPQTQKEQLMLLTLQWGGASGNGYMSKRQRAGAYAELTKKGAFEKGIFTYTDDEGRRHNQDSYEAMWENANGREIQYPEARYDCLVMNPENFGWRPSPKAPGVATKQLGSFTERDLQIGFLRLEAGAAFDFAGASAIVLLFVTKGAVDYDGKTYPKHTSFEITAADVSAIIRAVDTTEFLRVQLPSFEEKSP
jgi:hypothetical protein